jgi:hypothetical protein
VADEQVIKLLEEIRDLQKAHVVNYREAVENQKLAIEMQKKASRLQRIGLLVLIIIVFLGMATAILPSLIGR